MKRKRLQFLGISIFLWIILAGCATTPRTVYKSVPEVQKAFNEFYEASIMPLFSNTSWGEWKGFQLKIINRTNKDLELDWNRTYFISNGMTSGGFMFEGIVYRDRNKPKPPDILFPGSTFSKTIYPNNIVDFYSSGWWHKGIRVEVGALLSVKVDGREVREKMLIKFVPQQELR